MDVKTIKSEVAKNKEWLVAQRRHIHANPELSFQEEKTAAYIAGILTDLDVSFKTGVGGHGIVAEIGKGEKIIALRGDMDALPIQEENDVAYASKNPGVMHACGHDVHTTCMLGVAKVLKAREEELNGTIRILFQPAEERIPGGASLMIKDGVLKNPDVEFIFGQHVFPDMEVGNVGFRGGMYMASADEIHLKVHGKGGHGALPHKAIDPVLVSAHLITAIQQMVSRRARPDIPTVVTIGKVIANGSTNIIPDVVQLEGTIRTVDEPWRAQLHEDLTRLINGICDSMGARAELNIMKGYPCLINDEKTTAWAKAQAEDLLGEEFVHDLPIRMTAEDFAFFAQKVPACFYRLGTSNKSKGIGAPLHTSKFDVDEDALEIGTALMVKLAINGLNEL